MSTPLIRMVRISCIGFILSGVLSVSAQEEAPAGKFSISGYVDVYYVFDFSRQPSKDRVFTTMPYRHNEFNLNLGLVDARYDGERTRGRMALHTGTYAQSNYALETPTLQHIHEGYAGFRLGKSAWWIDAGVFGSHIGFEGAITMQHWTYSRSLMADYSPYYDAGVKLSGPLSAKTTATLVVMNGWQNIKETIDDKAFGTQIQTQLNDRVLLNWSTFVGNEAPNSAPSQIRIFNDWFARIRLNDKTETALVFDLGFQKRAVGGGYDNWHTAALLARIQTAPRVAIGGRVEYYIDKKGVIIASGTPNGFQTLSGSLNVDYAPANNMLWLVEGRVYRSKDRVFPGVSGAKRSSGFIATSIAILMN